MRVTTLPLPNSADRRCVPLSRIFVWSIILALVLASCGASTSDDEALAAATEEPAINTPAPEATALSAEPEQSDESDDQANDAGATTDEAQKPEPTGDDPAADLGRLDPVNVEPGGRLMTPIEGGGPHPLLEWEPIEGAAAYSVTVYDADGWVYWGTLVDVPQTYVGGPIQLKDDRPGPRITEGMSWSLTAWDENLEALAMSGRRPIAP